MNTGDNKKLTTQPMPKSFFHTIKNKINHQRKAVIKILNSPLEEAYRLVKNHMKSDFSLYDSDVIKQDLKALIRKKPVKNIKKYVNILKTNPEEIRLLICQLFTKHTSFFKPPETFDYIKKHIIQNKLQSQGLKNFRVWIAGCGGGEEAYSFAMIIKKILQQNNLDKRLIIFVTHTHRQSLEMARKGFYSENSVNHISQKDLKEFFTKGKAGYTIKESLKKNMIFSHHNLITDPPFSKIDLLVCRGTLRKFNEETRKTALSNMHYALNEKGYIIFHPEEIDRTVINTFRCFSKKHHIFFKDPSIPFSNSAEFFKKTTNLENRVKNVKNSAHFKNRSAGKDTALSILEHELVSKDKRLRGTIEKLSQTNDELTAATEEAQNSNEELRASQEELQSLNEELTSTNYELTKNLKELNSVNETLNNFLSATDIATIFLDNDLYLFKYTPAIKKIFLIREQDLGKHIREISSFLDKMHFEDCLKKVIKDHVRYEEEIESSDGFVFWMRILPYKKSTQKYDGLVVTFTDISTKKKQEKELTQYRKNLEKLVEEKSREVIENEKKYRKTVESISDGFFILENENHIITYFNKSAEEILAKKAENVVGKPLFDVFPEAKGSVFQKEYAKAYKTQKPVFFETYFDIKPIDNWYDVRVHPSNHSLSVFFQVITTRKKAELELKKTIEEKNMVLRELQHRIKNSFAMVSGFINLTAQGSVTAETSETLKQIDSKINALTEMYTLLYQTDSIDKVASHDYFENVIKGIPVDHKNIEVISEIQNFDFTVKTATAIGLIITEMITNSIKYAFTEKIKGRIHVIFSGTKDHYTLKIYDNGCGYPDPDHLEKKESMGMIIINSLVKQIHGSVKFTNENGAKAIITFTAK